MTSDLATSSRSERRRLRTRAALLEAGLRLFSERDVGEVTIQQITDAADVAKGSFYNHFESRGELHRAATAAALEEIGAASDRSVEQRERDPARVIAASLLTTLRTCLADPALGGYLLKNTDVAEFGNALLTRGRRDLLRGQVSGRFAFEDLDLMLIAVAGAGQSVLRARLRGDLPASAEPQFIAVVMRMLGIQADEAMLIATEVTVTDKGRTS